MKVGQNRVSVSVLYNKRNGADAGEEGVQELTALKYSRQRESIKNYLCGREDHPTADRIYMDIRREYPNISLGTVYRNLSLLVELGEIRKLTTDGADRFDANLEPHSHFICKSCGCVLDVMIPLENPAPEIDRLWDYGSVEECRLEFRGVCKKCQKNKNRA